MLHLQILVSSQLTHCLITDDVFIITVFCGTSDRSEIIAWWIYPVGNSGKKQGGKKSDPPGISV